MIDLPFPPSFHPITSYSRYQRYIAIEGADGVGKSTVARKLVEFLNSQFELGLCNTVSNLPKDPNAILCAQPTTGPIGALIRSALRSTPVMNDAALQLLFAADRINTSADIRAMLEDGHHVISDRCELSSAVYYAAARPRFLCNDCGEEVEEWEAGVRRAKRWLYDEHQKQTELVVVDVWRHRAKCYSDLLDVGQRRFDEALSWNTNALHPALILVLVTDQDVARDRLRGRGTPIDMMEREVIQRRAHNIYTRTAQRVRLGESSKVRAIYADGDEMVVWGKVRHEVILHLRDLERDDSCALSQTKDSQWWQEQTSIPSFRRVVWEVFDTSKPVERPVRVFERIEDLRATYPLFGDPQTAMLLEDLPLGTSLFKPEWYGGCAVRKCCQRNYSRQ